MIMAFSFCGAKRESRYSPVCGPVNAHAPGVCDADSIPFKQKNDHPGGVVILLVDLKGIEPSNLTDANRALSQLSYKPIFFRPLFESLMYYTTEILFVKKNIDYLFALRYNICVTFDKAVLVGEPAVPCRLQSATAGMNPRSRKFSVSSDPGKQ